MGICTHERTAKTRDQLVGRGPNSDLEARLPDQVQPGHYRYVDLT